MTGEVYCPGCVRLVSPRRGCCPDCGRILPAEAQIEETKSVGDHAYPSLNASSPSDLGERDTDLGSPDTDLGDHGYRLGSRGIPTWAGDPEALKGERLSRLDADPLIVAAVADLLGVEVGATFACVLPGHERKPGTARLWRDESGLVVYRDLHAVGGNRAYTLAEVYAALTSGRTRRREGPEHVAWKLRLLCHVGYVRPAEVVLPQPSPSASRAARQLRVGFALLHGLRQLREPGTATAFTKRFAADWIRVSEPTAYGGIRELIAEGVLVIDHADQSRRGFRPTPYYLPGGAS